MCTLNLDLESLLYMLPALSSTPLWNLFVFCITFRRESSIFFGVSEAFDGLHHSQDLGVCVLFQWLCQFSCGISRRQETMENQTAQENAPLLAGVKLSTALSSFTSPKEKQRDAGKVFKAPAPVLRERNTKEERKRGTPPNPVKVPPKSLFSYPERYSTCLASTLQLLKPCREQTRCLT